MFLILLLIMSFTAYGIPVDQLIFEHEKTTEISLTNGKKIQVTYRGFSEADGQKVFEKIKLASEKAQVYLEKHDFRNTDCRVLELEFYDLKSEVINNRKITTSVDSSAMGEKAEIYGYFDSITKANLGKSIIFMTANKKYDPEGLNEMGRKRIISHEVMHYWQDRTCNRHHDVESQAQNFAKEIINSSS